MSEKLIRIKVLGGKASQAPPLGPTLSQLGLDVSEVVNRINELTKDLEGLEVGVDIYVNTVTKDYKILVKLPTTTSLLLRYAGVSESSGDPKNKKVGNIDFESIVKIALIKKPEMNAKSLKAAVKSIISTARTIGLTIDGKDPKQVLSEVDKGLYNDVLSKYEGMW